MPSPLSHRLSKNLGQDVAEIEPALSNYLADFLDSVRNGTNKDVPGFGSFSLSDGQIVFAPDPLLVEAVNFRYQHLSSLTNDEVAISTESPVESSAGSSTEATVDAEPLPDEAVSETEPETGLDDIPVVVDLELVTDLPDEPSFAVQWVSDDAREEARKRSSDGIEREPVVPQKAVRTSSSSKRSGTAGQSDRRRKVMLVMIPLAAMAAVIAAVTYFGFGQNEMNQLPEEMVVSDDLSAATRSEEEQNFQEADISADTITSSALAPPPDTQTTQQSEPELVSNEVAEINQNAFVSDFDRSSPGYTLVIGSVFSPQDASSEMARYAALDLPRAVLAYDDEGITRYRLAIGQYDSIESAQAGLAQLGNQIPEGTWIRRIR